MVKVGSILVAWNQKKRDNRRRRESLKRSHCDSSEDLSMCMDSSNEESFNSGSRSLNLSGTEIEHRTSQSSRRSVRLESKTPANGMSRDFHSSFSGRSCLLIEMIIKNFKKLLGVSLVLCVYFLLKKLLSVKNKY